MSTGEQPWDKIWDFSKYRVSRVRRIVTRYRIVEKRDETRKIFKGKD